MNRTTTSSRRRPARRQLMVVGVCASALLVGCGDDDDETADAACEPYLGVTAAFNGEPDPATLTPMLDALDENAPDDIKDSVAVMTSAARQVMDSGGEDFSAFEAPEFGEAQNEVDPWMFDNCAFEEKEEVTAKDYEFEGLEDEYDAGQLAVLFTNEGEEAHELAVMRKADGVTESWDEILELPEEEAMTKAEQVGGTFAPREGTKGLGIFDLTAGDYIALCFVPTGTTMAEDGSFTEGTGVPHFMGGMRHEFTVGD